MADVKNHYPYTRRKSHISLFTCTNTTMIAILFMAVPVVQPFFMPSPSLTSHHSPSSSSVAPWSSKPVPPSLGVLPSIPSRNIHQRNSYGHRRNSILHSSKSDDSNADDDDNSKESKMPSDDALFRGSIDSTDSTTDELTLSDSNIMYGEDDDDDDDDDDDEDDDPYVQTAPSEFNDNENTPESISPSTSTNLATSFARQSRELNTSPLNWSGALSTLRSRVSDVESGKSTNPSNALFRTISRERPNEAIGRFVREANPEVVTAMTSAVSSLLGSISNPAIGVELIVQASSEKLGNLCFQLMMTGYMFRNAEYVLALKSLMDIEGEGTTLEEYRAAFQRLDTDGSGYLERDEIEALLAEIYDGSPPAFEIKTFVEFFDSNNDGRVSWKEFEEGFSVVTKNGGIEEGYAQQKMNSRFSLPGSAEEDMEEDLFGEPTVSGTIQVELEDGKIIEVDAQEYINDLKQQALELKRELAQEKGIDPKQLGVAEDDAAVASGSPSVNQASPGPGDIANYVSSLQGDVKSLTQGISPDVVESMKMLIDFVIEGGSEGGGNVKAMGKKKEMEMPGSALQQLALWQLVVGYRLRETEATGEWRQMLE